MPSWHLAQLNTARLRHPIDSAEMADFVSALDSGNAAADDAPGFVWRLADASGNATSLRPFGEDRIVNLSVWRDVESLRRYVYATDHRSVLRRRREWFDPTESVVVLWWVEAGHRPSIEEAAQRSEVLLRHGPTSEAFTFRSVHRPPGS